MVKDKSTCSALKKALLFCGRRRVFRNLQQKEHRKSGNIQRPVVETAAVFGTVVAFSE
jgi:hypothetical protein